MRFGGLMGLPHTAVEAGAATMPRALCVQRRLFGIWRWSRRLLGGVLESGGGASTAIPVSTCPPGPGAPLGAVQPPGMVRGSQPSLFDSGGG